MNATLKKSARRRGALAASKAAEHPEASSARGGGITVEKPSPVATVAQPTDAEVFLLAMAEHFNLKSRRDLSFTATSDTPGIRSNWSVPHGQDSYWGDTERIGRRMFTEIEALAVVDEGEACCAIAAAINDPAWNHTAHGVGWGIESGFASRLAELAIIGMRAVRAGWVFDVGTVEQQSPASEGRLA